MIDEPGIEVLVEPARDWSAEGPLSHRALAFGQKLSATLPANERQAFRIVVAKTPPEHTGFGVGTQMGRSVARAIAAETGHSDWTAIERATRIGRGERSSIGVHGFDQGGLIVEAGKLAGEKIAPLVGRFSFPNEWSILLFTPSGDPIWHGEREREAMAGTQQSDEEVQVLCRLILTGILPALASRNLDAFGDALYEYNARAGEAFQKVQGGRYSSVAVDDWVQRLRKWGIRGVGQSSWGPTVFAMVAADDVQSARQRLGGLPSVVTRVSAGARLV
jgi:beta-RFAP synthase